MSYAVSAALQTAIYDHLTGNAALTALVGKAIHDEVPAGKPPGAYVSLGPEEVQDRSDATGDGALHLITISVVSDSAGFQQAKRIAGAVCDALTDAELTLSRGTLVCLRFDRATARRAGAGETRRIDLRFRARVDDD